MHPKKRRRVSPESQRDGEAFMTDGNSCHVLCRAVPNSAQLFVRRRAKENARAFRSLSGTVGGLVLGDIKYMRNHDTVRTRCKLIRSTAKLRLGAPKPELRLAIDSGHE